MHEVDNGQSLTKYASPDAREGPDEFLSFLASNVAIEALLADRRGQAVLARILGEHFARDDKAVTAGNRAGYTIVKNPYPALEFRSQAALHFIHDAFELKDKQFYYFFPRWSPDEDVPPYLREEDVVLSDTYSFNKPIMRVAKSGGEAERFNYNSQDWEGGEMGLYSPSLRDRASTSIRGLVRKVKST